MSALGSLVVKLGLDYAQYTGGLDKSEQAALAASKKIQDTFDGMKVKLATTAGAIAGGLAAGFTIAAFKGIISGAIETGAALDDLRMQTGASVEALSGLMAVGKFNNMGPEQIGAAMNKLAANLAGASEESKGTGKALEVLGIDFDSFKKMRPEDQMQTVAKAMAQFEDGTGKAAVAMALYGKQGAQMLPFLHDLAEVETLAAKVTTEQAAAAANLDDNLTRLSTSGDAWKKELANGMIPALDLGAQAMLDVMNGSGGIRAEVRRLVEDGSVTRWTKSAITGLTYVADAAQYVMRGVKVLAESLGAYAAAGAAYFGGVGAAVGKVLRGDFAGALDSLRSGASQAGSVMQDLGGTVIQAFGEETLGSRIRARMGEIEATGGAAKNTAKSLDFTNVLEKTGKAATAAKNPVDALLESIDKRVAVLKEELTSGEKLTEGEKMVAEVRQKLATSTDAQIIAGRSLVETRLKDMLATEQQVVAHREELKALEATREARVKAVQAIEQSASSLVAQNQTMREEIELIGLTDAAQLRVHQSRNTTLILTKEATLAELERASVITGTMTREQIALQAEIDALRERNELLGAKYDRTAVAKAASEAAGEWTKFYDSIYNGLSDSLYRGFEAGKGFFKSFWDGIKNLFKTTVLKLAVQGVMTSITGGLGLSMTGANAGTLGSSGAGGGLGMLSSLGNMVSTGFDLITKGVSSAVGNAFGKFATSELGTRLGLSTPAIMGNNPSAYVAPQMTGLGSTIGAGLGMLGNGLMGYGISSAISGGYTTGGNTVNVLSGIASAFFGPLAGVVGGLINRLFGRKLADVGIEGTFGGKNGFDGQSFEFYKGGLLRSDKTKYSDLDPEFEKALGDTFKGMRAQVAFFADALGLSADRLEGYTSKIKFSTQGLNAEQIQAKFQEALATANNELAEQVLGTWETTSETVNRQIMRTEGHGVDMVQTWEEVEETITSTTYKASQYAKEGEKAIDTLTRLATSLTTVNGIWDTLGYTLLDASLSGADAASKIADAFGGLDKMVSATSSYFQNFYSEEERRATSTRQLDGEFEKLGLTMPKTREEYRRLVEAQDLNTDAGRKAYATLVLLSGSFAELNQSASEVDENAKEALRSQLDAAYSALERSIAAQRKVLEAQRAAAAELAGLWGNVQDIAAGSMRDLRGEVASTAAQQAAQGRVFIENALQGALLGTLPDADDLNNALTAARGGLTADNYLSQFELDRDRLVIAGQMEQLAGVAGKQKSIAEQSLDSLDRQIEQGDETLERMRELIDIATGQVNATLSVDEAVRQIMELLKPKTPVASGAGGSSSSGAGFGPGMPTGGAADAKYNRVISLGTAGVGYEPVIDQNQIAKLDALAPVYHKFDGTSDLKGLLEAVKSAGGTLNDLAMLTGFFDADWAKAAASVGVPAFRLGGDHRGGWAMVGEDGPELAYLPPARIYTASTTRRMLAGNGSGSTATSTASPSASSAESKAESLLARMAQVLEDSFDGNGFRTTPA